MLRILAAIFGIGLIAFGIIGFTPDFLIDGKIFAIFRVNFEHNIIHLVSGILALLCSLSSGFAAKMFFIFFGLAYAFLAFFGFLNIDGMLFEMIAINRASNFLHAILASLSLLFGICLKSNGK